jgi:hypothetical protein
MRIHTVLHSGVARGRQRRAYRWLAALVSGATVGLAVAGPARASELVPEVPVLEVTVPSEPEPAPISTAEALPDLLPAPALEVPPVVEVATQTDPGNVNVSVRVLSPGTDGPVLQSASPELISELPEPDITPEPDSVSAGPNGTSLAQPGAVNTNVAIRVLSPGDTAPVSQSTASAHEGGLLAEGDLPSATTGDAPASNDSALNSSQYHGPDFRYQFFSDRWEWEWTLTRDCLGNTTSASSQTGAPESLIWSWDWSWDWDCGADTVDASTPVVSSAKPPSTLSSYDPSTGAVPSARPADEPWAWTWMFTFCGQERTFSSRAGAGTPLSWTWDWTWAWTCGTAGGTATNGTPTADTLPPLATMPSPSTNEAGGEVTNGAADGPSATTQPATTLLPLPLPLSLPLALPPFVIVEIPAVPLPAPLATPPATPVQVFVDIAIPLVVLTVPASPSVPELPSSVLELMPEVGLPAPSVSPTPTTTGRPPASESMTPRTGTGVAPPTPAVVRAQRDPSVAGAHHTRAATKPRPHSASPRRTRGPLAPFGLPRRSLAVGSPSSGGVAPGALLLGVAALTGFFLLAAPGLGRRIQVARELSPRSLDQSPIDHPG